LGDGQEVSPEQRVHHRHATQHGGQRKCRSDEVPDAEHHEVRGGDAGQRTDPERHRADERGKGVAAA